MPARISSVARPAPGSMPAVCASDTAPPSPGALAKLQTRKVTRSGQMLRLCAIVDELATCALSRADTRINALAEAAQSELWDCAPLIHTCAHARAFARMREITIGARRRDLDRVGLAAAELYRILQREIPLSARTTPLRVSLLNYAGLKLMALTRRQPLDWLAIEGAAAEVDISWSRLHHAIEHTRMGGVTERAVELLAEGVLSRTPDHVGSAARRLHLVAHALAERAGASAKFNPSS